ncbi:TPM domain-containing protein [Carnobacteriaceae bacterium zg-ZUI252]|nr:TPM domain-containing protein [Carnobacteriaceae bacterium zg-ZUI252]
MSMMKKIMLMIVSFLLLAGFTVPTKPNNAVHDPNGYLDATLIQRVNDVNLQLAKSNRKPQIAVMMIDRLDGKSIEQAALETARAWKIGFSDTNMGALIFVSVKDRKMRIETSDEMATILTDAQANQLIGAAKDDFRREDYSAGVTKMVDGLLVTLGKQLDLTVDEQTTKRVEKYLSSSSNDSIELITVVIILAVLFIVSYSSRRYRRYGSTLVDSLFWTSAFNSGRRSSRRYKDDDDDDFFGGFGGGSSGGSSGGWSGGGFSGGGSSGGW